MKRKIAWKLAFVILLLSSVITLIITSVQLYIDYNNGLSHIDNQIYSIETGYTASLEHGIWIDDKELLNHQLIGILNLPDISYIRLDIEGSDSIAIGEKLEKAYITKNLELEYQQDERLLSIGSIFIMADLEGLYQQLWDKVFVIILSQGIKTFLVSYFILFLVQVLFIRHLEKIAHFSQSLNVEEPMQLLKLNKKPCDDELDEVVGAFNNMQESIGEKVIKLAEINENLDQLVISRTNELENNLKELKLAQKQLIQSEKMAALGGLVAGVAHEINTPIGIAVTGVSYAQELVTALRKHHQSNEMTELEFNDFLQNSMDVFETTYFNLRRAADLVKSFKQIAVDQSLGEVETFSLALRINQIIMSLGSRLKKTKIEVTVDCDESLFIQCDPGSIAQIFTNLIMNSLVHGFSKDESGDIHIRAYEKGENVYIVYTDNGKGISEDALAKVFDPFFTTNREEGGTGLGLNIIYNIITSQLGGEINVHSEIGKGVAFNMVIPHALESLGGGS